MTTHSTDPVPADAQRIGLGFDAGGTATRWALVDATGALLAEGRVAGFTALMMAFADGRTQITAALAELAQGVLEAGRGLPTSVYAGITGFSDDESLRLALATRVGTAFMLSPGAVTVVGDVELACADVFAPGEGIVVYSGTGSIGAFIDRAGRTHRVGGRGHLIDDGGSGYWIAREAMRLVWRREDERSGAWRGSPLARALFDQVGGADWPRSRDFFYRSTRGRIGELALAVASVAADDADARAILDRAGVELARLAGLLLARFGERAVALTGGASRLHPSIAASFREALGTAIDVRTPATRMHLTAARLALSAPRRDAEPVRAVAASRTDAVQRNRTEAVDPAYAELDQFPLDRLVDAFVDDQRNAVAAVQAAREHLVAAVGAAVPRIAAGGRLIYVGAGTSGRLGMLDAVELHPTFSWPQDRAIPVLAGGSTAIVHAVEGAEDDAEQGAADVAATGPGPNDVLLAVAASGRTPYVLGALRAAREAGALTIGIANNPGSALVAGAEIGITLDTGAEVIAGSTRLKAGTSQKIALNTFSSALMVGLNKVYGNLMVDMQPTNAKLRQRALAMTVLATGVDESIARAALERCDYRAKVAVVMLKAGLERAEAQARLAAHAGSVQRALAAP